MALSLQACAETDVCPEGSYSQVCMYTNAKTITDVWTMKLHHYSASSLVYITVWRASNKICCRFLRHFSKQLQNKTQNLMPTDAAHFPNKGNVSDLSFSWTGDMYFTDNYILCESHGSFLFPATDWLMNTSLGGRPGNSQTNDFIISTWYSGSMLYCGRDVELTCYLPCFHWTKLSAIIEIVKKKIGFKK